PFMDENLRPATGNPAPSTDPAPEESASQAPTATAEQGNGPQLVNEVSSDEQAPSKDDLGQESGASAPAEGQAVENETTMAAQAGTSPEQPNVEQTGAQPVQAQES